MRKLLALMALLCGAASTEAAEPQKWCSIGFDDGPAELVWAADGDLALTIGGKPVEIEGDGHEPAIASAWVLFSKEDKLIDPVWIYKDRIFWPCP
jgi:hypothetical protein